MLLLKMVCGRAVDGPYCECGYDGSVWEQVGTIRVLYTITVDKYRINCG